MDLVKPFLECIIAPEVTPEALEIFKKKKNLRVVTVGDKYESSHKSIKSVAGGYLVQEKDSDQGELDELEIVTDLHPSADELKAMKLGWTLVRYVKSNGIVYSSPTQLLAVGAGQMSRVDSVKIGIRKVNEAGLNLEGSILASDAFFPFSDSIEIAATQGVKVIIQPGGSIKDQDVIDKANELGLVMAFTKTRHFYH
jgi:phosphoribosylaminoimidazolecarboxamide formyltransferase/IMP cyclohydrolase